MSVKDVIAILGIFSCKYMSFKDYFPVAILVLLLYGSMSAKDVLPVAILGILSCKYISFKDLAYYHVSICHIRLFPCSHTCPIIV